MKELLIVDSLNHEELDPTLTIISLVKYASIHTSKTASINPITAPPTRLITFSTGKRNRRTSGLTMILCRIIIKIKNAMIVIKNVKIPQATGLTAVLKMYKYMYGSSATTLDKEINSAKEQITSLTGTLEQRDATIAEQTATIAGLTNEL